MYACKGSHIETALALLAPTTAAGAINVMTAVSFLGSLYESQ
jgi:hypothetical protein